MPISVKCTTCEKRYEVADNLAGKLVYCPNCKLSLDVPAADAAPEVEEIEVLEEEEDASITTYGVNDPLEKGVSSLAAAAASVSFGGALGVVKTNREAKCLAYSPGNKYALAGIGPDVLVLDARNTKKIFRFDGHDETVTALSFGPSGDLALTADRRGALVLWQTETGRTLKRIKAHQGPAFQCAISPNGKYAISGGEDGLVRLWDLATGADIPLLKNGWDEPVTALCYSHDGKHILAGGDRGRLALWSVRTGERLMKFRASQEAIEAVTFSHDSTEFIAAGFSKRSENGLMAWRYRLQTQEQLPAFANPSQGYGSVYCMTLGPNGHKLIVGAEWEEIISYTGGSSAEGFATAAMVGGLLGAAIYSTVANAKGGESEMRCGLHSYTVDGGVRGAKIAGVRHPVVEVTVSPDGLRALGALEDGDLAFFAIPP